MTRGKAIVRYLGNVIYGELDDIAQVIVCHRNTIAVHLNKLKRCYLVREKAQLGDKGGT